MAKKFVLVDDVDGAEDDVQTVKFMVDGRNYEIELGVKNRTKFNAQIEYWTSHARTAGSKKSTASSSKPSVRPSTGSGLSSDELQARREWTKKNGWPNISDRGRVSKEIHIAFDAAHDGKLFKVAGGAQS